MGRGRNQEKARSVLLGRNRFASKSPEISKVLLASIKKEVLAIDSELVRIDQIDEFKRLKAELVIDQIDLKDWKRFLTESRVIELSDYRLNRLFHQVFFPQPGKPGLITTETNGNRFVHTYNGTYYLETIENVAAYIVDRDNENIDRDTVEDNYFQISRASENEYGKTDNQRLFKELARSKVVDSSNDYTAKLTKEFLEYAFLVLPDRMKGVVYG